MEIFVAVMVGTYYLGQLVAIFVLPRRVGLNRYAWVGAFMHPPSRRNGIPWAVLSFLKIIAWPILLGYWLVQDRPPSRVLFGSDAAEMLYGDPDRAMPGFVTKWKRSST